MNVETTFTARTEALLRDEISLDGEWDFRHESHHGWHTATVPGFWQAQFDDLAVAFGTARYARDITVPSHWADREVALCFGAASDSAVIRLNGDEIARHQGGYLPFEVVLPAGCAGGTHRLEVDCLLPDAHRHGDAPNFAEVPHGKQSWYGPQGGIWQSVVLQARAHSHITRLHLTPHWPDGRLDLDVTLSTPVRGSLRLDIAGPSGDTVHRETVAIDGNRAAHRLTLRDIQAWSPDTPALYTLRATLATGGPDLDERTETFGFRKIETRDGQLWLNGQPLFLRGALDQDYYPDGFGAPPSLDLLEDQARKAKSMGLNCLRCHIKIPDPRYYEVADRLGLLIWTEIPNIETFTPLSAELVRRTMEGILARDRNHPSIIIWTVINEDWGTRLREVAEQRAWLSDMVDWLRAEDPLRLVVDNSACFPNWHVNTDINDFHYYRTAVDRREEWDLLNAEFAANADWTFGTGPDITRTGKEPLIVSEFGVWGLPQPDLLRTDGKDPWWMSYGATWAEGVALPLGVEARFRELGLSQVFGSFPAFIDAVQWFQWTNLKHEIEVMRRHPTIAGYVITEFTDVHWEGNGLLDMARNPRIFVPAMPKVVADIVISPGLARHSARAGDPVTFDLTIATGGASLPEGSTLHWTLGDATGEASVPATGPMQAVPVPVTAPTPATAATSLCNAGFSLLAPDGSVLAQNDETLSLYAKREVEPVHCATDNDDIAERLTALGHIVTGPSEAQVFVTHDMNAPLIEDIHAGTRVLQLVAKKPGQLRNDPAPRDGPMSIAIDGGSAGMESAVYFFFPGYKLLDRHHNIWRGDWVGNFSWLRRDGAFAHLPGGPLFDLSFTSVVPRQVIVGFRPWEFQGRVHSGVVVGWVHKPGAYILEKRLGRGKFVATTFRLDTEDVHADPVATALLDGLLALTAKG